MCLGRFFSNNCAHIAFKPIKVHQRTLSTPIPTFGFDFGFGSQGATNNVTNSTTIMSHKFEYKFLHFNPPYLGWASTRPNLIAFLHWSLSSINDVHRPKTSVIEQKFNIGCKLLSFCPLLTAEAQIDSSNSCVSDQVAKSLLASNP